MQPRYIGKILISNFKPPKLSLQKGSDCFCLEIFHEWRNFRFLERLGDNKCKCSDLFRQRENVFSFFPSLFDGKKISRTKMRIEPLTSASRSWEFDSWPASFSSQQLSKSSLLFHYYSSLVNLVNVNPTLRPYIIYGYNALGCLPAKTKCDKFFQLLQGPKMSLIHLMYIYQLLYCMYESLLKLFFKSDTQHWGNKL